MLFVWAVTATVVAGFFAVLAYGAWMGRGQIEATAGYERGRADAAMAEISRLSSLVVSKNCEIEALSEYVADLEHDMTKAHEEVKRQDTIIGELKADNDKLTDENRKLSDRKSRAVGLLTEAL